MSPFPTYLTYHYASMGRDIYRRHDVDIALERVLDRDDSLP